LSRQLTIYFQIQIKPSSTSYICTSYLHNIVKNKPRLYQVPNKVFRNKIIPSIQKLTQLEERFMSSCLAFAQIGCEYKKENYVVEFEKLIKYEINQI
jgi:hypothetical protein